jgi:hypothetical protein
VTARSDLCCLSARRPKPPLQAAHRAPCSPVPVAAVHESGHGRLCCKRILCLGARKIDSRSGANAQLLIQKSMRPDSIVSNFYSTASPRRLLQHYRHIADLRDRPRQGLLPDAKRTFAAERAATEYSNPSLTGWGVRRDPSTVGGIPCCWGPSRATVAPLIRTMHL